MKHLTEFTATEFATMLKLINKKTSGKTKDEQLTIRNEIRKIGFHWSDFSNKKHGYTVKDIQDLLAQGKISIVG